MITNDGKIKVIDFGIARRMGGGSNLPSVTSAGSFLGKVEYAAPELVLGDINHQNQTTDIYAIGILLYLLITGQLPFVGEMNEVMKMQQNKKLPLKNIKDKKLRKIIEKATEKAQKDRYQSAAAFRVAIEDIGIVLAESPKAALQVSVSKTEQDEALSIQQNEGQAVLSQPISQHVSSHASSTPNNTGSNKRYIIVGAVAMVVLVAGVLVTFLLSSKGDKDNLIAEKMETSMELNNPKSDIDTIWAKNSLGKKYRYVGETDNEGVPHGQGKAWFDNDLYYEGEFDHGDFADGKTALFIDGKNGTFKGEFRDNAFYKGEFTYASDGAVFKGSFKNGQPDKGILYDKDGNKIE